MLLLIQFNLEEFLEGQEFQLYDIKDNLFQGLIIREKELRDFVKTNDWSVYQGKHVGIYCSTDAIIPTWAYMLVSSYLHGIAKEIFQGSAAEYYTYYYKQVLNKIDYSQYQDKRIVIKGCSDKPVPTIAYMEITSKIKSYAKSIMYGEPCSTVPIFKKPRKV